jgi:hypothetical protein
MQTNQVISKASVEQHLRVLMGEKITIKKRIDELTQEIMKPTVDIRSAWERTLDGGFIDVDTKTSLREDLEMLEGQQRLLDEAIEGGRKELDRVRGQESLKACQAARPAVVAEAKILLLALRKAEKANRKIRKLFENLHDEGHTTGSLPHADYDLGGAWNDPRGGRLVFYCKDVAGHYPELKDLVLSPLEAE